MSKFIELTTDEGSKIIVNPDAVDAMVGCGSLGTTVYFRNHSEAIKEDYETVKSLLVGEHKQKVTAEEIKEMLERNCDSQKRNCGQTWCFECECKTIADYINGKKQ